MSARPEAEARRLVEGCLDQLRRLPFVRDAVIETVPAGGRDATIAIKTPVGREVLQCEVKRTQLGRESAQFVVHRFRHGAASLLLAPVVGRELGDFFEQKDVSFVDATGNCYLRLGDRYLARIQGRTAPRRRPRDRALRAAAYRALFALLVKPDLVGAPVRAIAAEADVCPQTVSNLVQGLVDRGLVLRVRRRRQWAPGRRQDAIATWLAGFRTVLAPSLVVGRYRARETDPRELEQRIEPILDAAGDWRYGGGAAAMRLAHHYRGDTTTLYLRDVPADLPARLRLTRDAAGPVVVSRTPATVAFDSPDPRSVHPLLVYADLVSEDHERAHEAARVLHERFLAEGDRGT
jgi:hypothetical protein